VVNIRIEDEFELEFEDDGSTNVQEAKRPASLTREQSGTLRLSGTATSSKADPDPAGHGMREGSSKTFRFAIDRRV
jgi:hypothetical protein